MTEETPEEIYQRWRVNVEPSIRYLSAQEDKTLQDIGSKMNQLLACLWALSTKSYVEAP